MKQSFYFSIFFFFIDTHQLQLLNTFLLNFYLKTTQTIRTYNFQFILELGKTRLDIIYFIRNYFYIDHINFTNNPMSIFEREHFTVRTEISTKKYLQINKGEHISNI